MERYILPTDQYGMWHRKKAVLELRIAFCFREIPFKTVLKKLVLYGIM